LPGYMEVETKVAVRVIKLGINSISLWKERREERGRIVYTPASLHGMGKKDITKGKKTTERMVGRVGIEAGREVRGKK